MAYKMKTTKIEKAVVGAYKKIESFFVNGYKKIEKAFVETFLEKVEDEPEAEPATESNQ